MSKNTIEFLVNWFFLFAICMLGQWFGEWKENKRWEALLMDNPAQVAVIKSRVIAERAEEASEK